MNKRLPKSERREHIGSPLFDVQLVNKKIKKKKNLGRCTQHELLCTEYYVR